MACEYCKNREKYGFRILLIRKNAHKEFSETCQREFFYDSFEDVEYNNCPMSGEKMEG